MIEATKSGLKAWLPYQIRPVCPVRPLNILGEQTALFRLCEVADPTSR